MCTNFTKINRQRPKREFNIVMPGQFRTLVMFYVWFVSIMQVYVYQPRNVCVLSAQAAEGDDQDKEERGGACTDVSHLHLACG